MTHASDVRKMLKAADWITDLDAPVVGALKTAAKALDEGKGSPSLLGQYRLLVKQLMESRTAKGNDEDDDLLGED